MCDHVYGISRPYYTNLLKNLSIQELRRKISPLRSILIFFHIILSVVGSQYLGLRFQFMNFTFFDSIVLPTFAKLITVTKLANLLTSSP